MAGNDGGGRLPASSPRAIGIYANIYMRTARTCGELMQVTSALEKCKRGRAPYSPSSSLCPVALMTVAPSPSLSTIRNSHVHDSREKYGEKKEESTANLVLRAAVIGPGESIYTCQTTPTRSPSFPFPRKWLTYSYAVSGGGGGGGGGSAFVFDQRSPLAFKCGAFRRPRTHNGFPEEEEFVLRGGKEKKMNNNKRSGKTVIWEFICCRSAELMLAS